MGSNAWAGYDQWLDKDLPEDDEPAPQQEEPEDYRDERYELRNAGW